MNIWHLREFSVDRFRQKKLDSIDKVVCLLVCNTILYMIRLVDPAGQNGIFSYKVETRISAFCNINFIIMLMILVESWVKVMHLSGTSPIQARNLSKLRRKRFWFTIATMLFACFFIGGAADGMELFYKTPDYAKKWIGGSRRRSLVLYETLVYAIAVFVYNVESNFAIRKVSV